MSFIVVASVLMIVAALMLCWPLLSSRGNGQQGSRSQLNKRVLNDQLAELEQQLDGGLLDDQQAQELRDELYQEALESVESGDGRVAQQRKHTVAVAVLLLLMVGSTFAIYDQLGAKDETELATLTAQLMTAADRDQRLQLVSTLVPRLQGFLQKKPNHAQYRFLLAQAQTQREDFSAAAINYQKLLELEGDNAEVLALYAQSSYLAENRSLSADAQAALLKALQINPAQRTALGLQGMSAFEGGDYALAISSWQALKASLLEGSSQAQTIDQALQRARQLLGPQAQSAQAALPEKQAAAQIAVQVSASKAAKAAGGVVFIYARAANGPKMPLAIVRKNVSELPASISLGDAQAMMPAMRLSNFEQIEVLARISTTANAVASPGDWQASSGVLNKASISKPISLYIDQQIK